jgi:hypothetical protein
LKGVKKLYLELRKTILRIFILSLFALLPIISSAQVVNLPDGTLGKPNGSLFAQYAAMSTGTKIGIADQKSVGLELRLPAMRRLTLAASYFVRKGDSVYHNFRVEVKFYSGNPAREAGKGNPDGAVRSPIFSVAYGGEFPDQDPPANRYKANFQALVPISTHFSLGAGGNYYQDKITRRADKVYGVFNIFPRAYSADDLYLNPDGVEGVPSLAISGGGSEKGFFGQLDISIPLNPGTTLVFYTRGERYPRPYLRTAIFGCRVSIYPTKN